MAYQREPQDYDASPNPPASNGWWPIIVAIGVLIAFAYWFFSVDWKADSRRHRNPARGRVRRTLINDTSRNNTSHLELKIHVNKAE